MANDILSTTTIAYEMNQLENTLSTNGHSLSMSNDDSSEYYMDNNLMTNTTESSLSSPPSTALLLSRAIWLALQNENLLSKNDTRINNLASTLLANITDSINQMNQSILKQSSIMDINTFDQRQQSSLPISSRIAAAAAAAAAAASVTSSDRPNTQSSSTTATTDDEDFYRHSIMIITYSLIIIVSLCGNSLVLKMILTKKKLQTTTNILIAWLAVSDLLTTTLNIPFNVTRFILMNYPFPALFCKLVPFIQVMCVYVSTFTMGVIAVHRYMTVTSTIMITSSTPSSNSHNYCSSTATVSNKTFYRPLLLHGSSCLCMIMTLVWIIAGLLATPHSMFNQIVYVPYQNRTYVRCRAEYPQVDFDLRLTLSVEAFLTQYLKTIRAWA